MIVASAVSSHAFFLSPRGDTQRAYSVWLIFVSARTNKSYHRGWRTRDRESFPRPKDERTADNGDLLYGIIYGR